MSKLLYLAVAVTLLGISACTPENKDTPMQTSPQTAAESNVAPAAPIKAQPAEAPSAPAQTAQNAEQPAAAPAAPAVAPPTNPATPAASGALTQEQALALAKANGCLACHKIDAKLVGPAWKEVGAKYKDDAHAARTIAANIRKGGSFGWKFGFMPARGGSKISDADIDRLAGFIAALK